jgi:endo-alpha-1,4-polygalactosaminidase (GH114 family)
VRDQRAKASGVFMTSNLERFKNAGKLVLVTDYGTREEEVNDFHARATGKGFVPYETVRGLDRFVGCIAPARVCSEELADVELQPSWKFG